MTGRKAILGLCMLCALAFSAIAAQGASAKGQTAFTCVEGPKGQFSTEHCVPGQSGTKYEHVEFSEETHATLTNEKTNATTTGPTNSILKVVIAATNLELKATGIHGEGILRNEVVGTEMRAFATGTIVFSGVEVAAPAGKGCKVFTDNNKVKGAEGTVMTEKVKGHTTVVTEEGKEIHSVIIEPDETGFPFARFFIECEKGKVPAELEGTWEITGTLTCPTHGATIECNHNTVTETKGLKAKGAKAGLEGKATITAGKGLEPPFGETHPISVTTEP